MSENASIQAFSPKDILNAIMNRSDIAFAVGLVMILVVLIMPLPSWMLDLFLTLSITFAVLILMTTVFIEKPLEFSSFPTVLLIATMIRLSLNLASTRLILSDGHSGTDAAGHVIQAFGDFVMGGNYIIGMIIFGILVIVNFVVITKGSTRIAEVSARFSLDAMPGKQMAIDADLSAGLITEDEAKARRKELEDENSFFGSMDGASKFVRGDAVAGIFITFINIIGGIIIGIVYHDLNIAQAADTYTALTIGDGLVSQIPALIVSLAAGLLVSKAGLTGRTDKALFGQLTNYPTALGLCAILLGALAVLPGIPFLPFMVMAGICGYTAWQLDLKKKEAEVMAEKQEEEEAAEQQDNSEQPATANLVLDQVRLELGLGLLQLVQNKQGPKLTDQIKAIRRQMATDMGFLIPSIRIQDNMQLDHNDYSIRIKEIENGKGSLQPNKILAMDPSGNPIDLPGQETVEPTFGLPAKWINEDHREEALFRGCTVVDLPTIISTHLTEIIRENMADLLSYAETKKLLDNLDEDNQKLVSDLIPQHISIIGVQKILQNLLNERISIRDLPTILEGIFESASFTRSTNLITEHVRGKLARQICDGLMDPQGSLPIVTLSSDWEVVFQESLMGESDDKILSLPPSKMQEFVQKINECFERLGNSGLSPVLVTSGTIRPYVKSILERFRPLTGVISHNELHPKVKVQTYAQVE